MPTSRQATKSTFLHDLCKPFKKWILLVGMSPAMSLAQGNLLMTPRRIIFEGPKKTQEINLANTGKDTATYLISMVEIRMTENGAFEEVQTPDSGQFFASKYLRFFPRTVTLGPNEAQTVKVQVTKTALLPPGEYRSHIYFRAVPEAVPLDEKKLPGTADSNISINIKAIFGITIPVIIRVGNTDTRLTISDLAMKMHDPKTPGVRMVLNRSGNMSSYGDIIVQYISPEGISTQVGMAKGVAVYTPNARRRFELDLNKDLGINYKTGKLQVSYTPQTDSKKSAIKAYATSELLLK